MRAMRIWITGPRLFGLIRPSFPLSFTPRQSVGGRGTSVYVIESSAGYVKIGHSNDPEGRLLKLQTGSPHTLKIAYVATFRSAERVEQEAHRLLGARRVNGEWFDVTKEMAIASVYGAAARLGQVEELSQGRGWPPISMTEFLILALAALIGVHSLSLWWHWWLGR